METLWRLICLSGLLWLGLDLGSAAPLTAQESETGQAVWLSIEPSAPSPAESESADATDRVLLNVSAAAVVNLGAAQFEIHFPGDAWEFDQAKAGSLLSSALLESNLASAGQMKVAFVSSESIDGSGTLLTVELKRKTPTARLDGFELKNFQAWRQEDSADSVFVVRPAVGAPPPPVAPPIPATETSVAPSAVSSAQPPSPPVVVNVPPTELHFPESLNLKVEVPGSLWFSAGALCGLLAGGLIAWLNRSK